MSFVNVKTYYYNNCSVILKESVQRCFVVAQILSNDKKE
jgi:hypothetical protein